jgi:hypothetical protein
MRWGYIPVPLLVLGLAGWTHAQTTAPATASAVSIDVRVDPRVELFCVIFQLAGNPEYNQGKLPLYSKDIQEHFAPYRDHAVVQLARRLRNTRGVGFDAPMSLASKVSDDVRKLELLVPLEPWPEGLDQRWTADDIQAFVRMARRFVADSHFEQFLDSHHDLYDASAQRMRQTLQRDIRLDWFDPFFGTRGGEAEFHLVLGLCAGGSNYGTRVRIGGQLHYYAVIGAWRADAQGVPQYNDRFVAPTIVHEFCHSYCNLLIDAHLDELRDTGDRLFASKAKLMRQQAYSHGTTVLYETLVRASVARYRFDTLGPTAGMTAVLDERTRGFEWVGDVVSALGEYERQRDEYPTLDAFMPRIAECLNGYASKLPNPDE